LTENFTRAREAVAQAWPHTFRPAGPAHPTISKSKWVPAPIPHFRSAKMPTGPEDGAAEEECRFALGGAQEGHRRCFASRPRDMCDISRRITSDFPAPRPSTYWQRLVGKRWRCGPFNQLVLMPRRCGVGISLIALQTFLARLKGDISNDKLQ